MDELKKFGVNVRNLQDLRFTQRISENAGDANSYKELVLHLIDAQEVLGISGTLAIFYERDVWKEWGWRSVHDPFSFGRHFRTFRFIEKRHLDDLESRLLQEGAPKCTEPVGESWFHSYRDQWARIQKCFSNR